jgi:ubiquitin-like 1-activating enzyme E1 B
VFQTSAYVDLSRATLDNLVNDFLRMDMGYGDKAIAVNNEVGLLYDEDETENLRKTLADLGRLPRRFLCLCFDHVLTTSHFLLGIKPNSFLTIIDEENEDTCVNVVINIQEA